MGHYDDQYEAMENERLARCEEHAAKYGYGCSKHKDYKGDRVPRGECNDCWTIFIRRRIRSDI